MGFGFNKFFLKKIAKRFEFFLNFNQKDIIDRKKVFFLKFLFKLIPINKMFMDQYHINIILLDLINSYRGYRHIKGLPTRGQRTWTNANTVHYNNNFLKKFKLKVAKKVYGLVPINNINISYLAEQMNALWKNQWENEWKKAKKKRLDTLKYKKGLYRIDLKSMAEGNFNERKKKKKDKSQNSFTLGFDPGFTKILLKASLKNTVIDYKKHGKLHLVFSEKRSIKKKIVKKKGVKPKLFKKKKKSAWD